MKICILPNDALLSYYNKGEIKNGYYNPKNMFDEVHVISLFDEEIGEEKVQIMAGNAKLKIHKIQKVNLSNYKSFEEKIIDLVREIHPDIIRSYNPLVQGWLATKASKRLGIPLVVSLHTNYEQQRDFLKKEGKYFQFLKMMYASQKIEKFVLQNADAVVCVYQFIFPYAKKMGAKIIHVIYNRVNLNEFTPDCKKEFISSKPTILSVGRLIEQKDHGYLIESIKDLDVNLLLIGDGPNYESLLELAKSIGVSDRVEIINRIAHEKLNGYYAACDIYAQPMKFLDGIPMPVLEAMASGLPVVMSRHDSSYSEIIDDAVVFVENDGKKFSDAFKKILSNSEYKEDLREKSLETIKKISGEIMEQREYELYQDLIKKKI
ncbi:MAG TPA: glycosyltransferase family 4 protein [Verrucomicrobiae bacterium]|nr:glycosyltransferase family 4 protein [Verrucomicrobiae bacterium]